MSSWRHGWVLLLLALLAVQLVARWLTDTDAGTRVPYSQVLTWNRAGLIDSVWLTADDLRGTLRAPGVSTPGDSTRLRRFSAGRIPDDGLGTALQAQGVTMTAVPARRGLESVLAWVLPLLAFALVWGWLLQRGGGGGAMAAQEIRASRARVYVERATRITFADVAGVAEAKAELQELVHFLKDPGHFGRLGAHMPKGVLLVGPPGTGKTLLARAVAGEAGVPFFSINGSEFVELFVGVGAARVRHLFQQARGQAPCILFIDEIDALGRSRGASVLSGANDEKEQTLNQLLAELDGFTTEGGVVLLAATNRPEILDPALLRAGRFDRQILVDRPDRTGRAAILAVHARGVTVDPSLDLDTVAALTPGFTGADLANLVNEAALVATRRQGMHVTLEDFQSAVERLVAGLARGSRVITPRDRHRTAVHEMGHALVALATPGADPVQKVSIIPRAMGALGFTMQRPVADRYLSSRTELDGQLAVLLAGRAAELVTFDDLSTGAADDLARATMLARTMVTRFGMDPIVGHVTYEGEAPAEPWRALPTAHDRGSEATVREIEVAVRELLTTALAQAVATLQHNRIALDQGVRLLLERETLSRDALPPVTPLPVPTTAPIPDLFAEPRPVGSRPTGVSAIG